MKKSFVIKGTICHTPELGKLEIREDAYVVCEDGICAGVFGELPERFADLPLLDHTGKAVIPGLVDLHIHAPQYAIRGTGYDHELLEWLYQNTFPEEMHYADPDYANRAYDMFTEKMRRSATTRAVIFGTIHREATLGLMEKMERSGLVTYVGKVNMDRNAPEGLLEKDALAAAEDTRQFILEAQEKGFARTKPIITPRFVPSCSDQLLKKLGELSLEYRLPVQSHLSENKDEVQLVQELVPEAAFYGDAYDRYHLFGGRMPAVMAHCVHSSPAEVERIKQNGVWVAHCPASNMNLTSGIAPMRRYLSQGLRCGLGTDVSAGTSASMFRAVTDAIQVSKLYRRYIDPDCKPLTFAESLFLASKGGGAFFGKVGSFEKGYEFDALILSDESEPVPRSLRAVDRLERIFYLGLDQAGIVQKFVAGREI